MDLSTHQAKFTLKDQEPFDLQTARQAFKERGFSDVKVVAGPS